MFPKVALSLLCLYLFSITAFSQQGLELVSKPITLKGGLHFNLKIPKSYNISVAADQQRRLRFLAKSPDGRLFGTDLHSTGDNKRGKVLIFENWNNTTHRFDKTTEYLTGLRNPNQVAFYTINKQHFLYVAETGFIKRYNYNLGDSHPADTGKVIARYPDYGLNYKYGGWHLTRSLAFHNNKLYVSIGSSCNACIEKETNRAVIIEMNPDGSNPIVYATGLRNSVGIKWIKDELWVTSMGRDLTGPDWPEDLFFPIIKNSFYGWPYYYQFNRKILFDKQFKDSAKPALLRQPPIAPYSFKAHSAPLGFDYFTGFDDPNLNNSFLVALHGSTSAWRQRGNSIVQMINGTYREVVTGFLQGKTKSKRFGRPCDIMQWSNTSFFITDDKNGVLYYLWKS